MKAIVLAAGYARRLYPLTRHQPKALLTVADKPIIEHIVDKLLPIPGLNHIYVTVNDTFAPKFQKWLEGYRSTKAGAWDNTISNSSIEDSENVGAIGSLHQVLTRERVDDDIIIIAADNLFSCEIESFAASAQQQGAPVVAIYDIGDHVEGKKYGCVVVDEIGKITHFEEKPKIPNGTTIGVALYYYPKSCLPLIRQYIDEGKDPEHIGLLVEWMHRHTPFYTWRVPSPWFDIGSIEMLEEANRFFVRAYKGKA